MQQVKEEEGYNESDEEYNLRAQLSTKNLQELLKGNWYSASDDKWPYKLNN